MKNWTTNYSIEKKLEILEKEWLPLVIEKSSKRSEAEESVEFFREYGIFPITSQSISEPNTFQEYLNERPILKKVDEIMFRSEGLRFI